MSNMPLPTELKDTAALGLSESLPKTKPIKKPKKGKQGEGGGRPPSWDNVEKFQEEVKGYLEECADKRLMPNRAGLSVHLGISRDTYYEYRKKGHKFSDTLKRFEQASESAWVQRLASNAPTGAIFYLKNAFKEDYRDKTETDLTTLGEKITNFSHEQATAIARRIVGDKPSEKSSS